MVRHPAEQPITLVSRVVAGQDELGADVYGDGQTWTVTGLYAPEGSIEFVSGRETVIDQPTVYLFPPVPTLTAVDLVRVNGDEFEIQGKPRCLDRPRRRGPTQEGDRLMAAQGYRHDYAAFGEHVLCADWLVEELRIRAGDVLQRGVQIAPVSPPDEDEPDADHYIDHFSVEAGVETYPDGKRRAIGKVINDHDAAIDIEYGTGPDRPQGGSSPRFRVLGRALEAAGDQ
jgi:hypothetical protein